MPPHLISSHLIPSHPISSHLICIAILQAVTFDTWTDPLWAVMAAYSYSAWLYFILVAILGGLFVVNLFLAVIFDEFMRAQVSKSVSE